MRLISDLFLRGNNNLSLSAMTTMTAAPSRRRSRGRAATTHLVVGVILVREEEKRSSISNAKVLYLDECKEWIYINYESGVVVSMGIDDLRLLR